MSFREELQGITSQKVEESQKERQKLEEELRRRFDEGIKEFIESINHEDIINELKLKAVSGSKADILLEYPDKLKKAIFDALLADAALIKIEKAVTKHIKLNPGLASVYITTRVLKSYSSVTLEFSWEEGV